MYVLCLYFAILLASLSPTPWLVPADLGCHGSSFLADVAVVFVPLAINLAGPAALFYLLLKQITGRGYLRALSAIKPTAIPAVPVVYAVTVLAYVATASFGFTTLVSMSVVPLLWLLSLIGLWEVFGIVRACLKRNAHPVEAVSTHPWTRFGVWLALVPTVLGLLVWAALPAGSFSSGAGILDSYENRCPNLAAQFKQSMQGQSWPPRLVQPR